MSVNVEIPVALSVANGATNTFPHAFTVLDAADLTVQGELNGVQQTYTLGTHYTLTGVGTNSGSVIFGTAPASGTIVKRFRNMSLSRSTDYQDNGDLLAKTVDDDFDRIWLALQDAGRDIDRSVRFPIGEVATDLPPPDERASKVLGFNGDGDLVATVPASGTAADVLSQLSSSSLYAGASLVYGVARVVDSLAEVRSLPKTGAKTVHVTGYYEAGDGGGGHYFYDSTDTTSSDNGGTVIVAGDGGRWKLATAHHVTPRQFGAKLDGVADDTAKMQAWGAATNYQRRGQPGTAKVSGSVDVGVNADIDFDGLVIDASAGGTWTNDRVFGCLGSLSAIPDLSSSPIAGAQTLGFASAHGLVDGDVAIIYNPTDRSWYPPGTPSGGNVRDYYRDGEFFRVARIASSTSILSDGPLFSGYTAANVDVYKVAPNECRLRNLTVIGPTSTAVAPIMLSLCTRFILDNVKARGNYMGIYLDRCFSGDLYSPKPDVPTSAVSDVYGLFWGSCQRIRVFGGALFARNGAFDIGGDSFTGSVPNRDVKIFGAHIANDPASTFPALDLHANLQGLQCIGCRIPGGAAWAGMDVEYIDCDISSPAVPAGALVVGGSDWLGGKAVIKGGSLSTTTAGSTNAVIRTVVNDYAKADTTLVVDCMDVDAGSNTIYVKTEMVSTATKKCNVVIPSVSFKQAASLTQVIRMQGTGSGGSGDKVIVDFVDGAPSGCNLLIFANGFSAATPARLMQQRAEGTIDTSTSADLVSVNPITWRYSYGSKVPKPFGYGCDTVLVGAKRIGTGYRSINAGSGVVDVFTCDKTNFSSVVSVTGFLTVGVNEL